VSAPKARPETLPQLVISLPDFFRKNLAPFVLVLDRFRHRKLNMPVTEPFGPLAGAERSVDKGFALVIGMPSLVCRWTHLP
jgi:hypothetical protein